MSAARRPRTALITATAAGVVLAAFVAVLATRSPAIDKQSTSPLLGKAAPAIAGNDLAGQPTSLAQWRGRFVVVNFFATWCVPCQREHPELQRFVARHATAADASVLGVLFDDDTGNARAFMRRNGGDWPIIDDADGRVALAYGVRGPPESFVVDPGGSVVAKFIGGVTADGLDQVLARVRRGSA